MKPLESRGNGFRQLISNGLKEDSLGRDPAQPYVSRYPQPPGRCPVPSLLGAGAAPVLGRSAPKRGLQHAGAGSKAPQGTLARGKQPSQAAPGQKIRLCAAGRDLVGSRAGAKAPGNWSGRFPSPGGCGCPAHTCTLPCRAAPAPRWLLPPPSHSRICAKAGLLQSRGMRHLLPQGMMLLEANPWPCRHPGPTVAGCPLGCRGQAAARSLCSAPRTRSQESRWFGWRAGEQCQGRSTASSQRPGTMPACAPSPPGTAPEDFALRHRRNLPRPCPCHTAAALKHMASTSTPKRAPAGTRVPGSGPVDSTRGATQPHGADSSSWVVSPVIDVLSVAQQLSWFRVNCARNYPAQQGWGSPGGSRQHVCGVHGCQSWGPSGRAMLGESSVLGSPSQLLPGATWAYEGGHSTAEATKATWRDASRDARCYKQPRAL